MFLLICSFFPFFLSFSPECSSDLRSVHLLDKRTIFLPPVINAPIKGVIPSAFRKAVWAKKTSMKYNPDGRPIKTIGSTQWT